MRIGDSYTTRLLCSTVLLLLHPTAAAEPGPRPPLASIEEVYPVDLWPGGVLTIQLESRPVSGRVVAEWKYPNGRSKRKSLVVDDEGNARLPLACDFVGASTVRVMDEAAAPEAQPIQSIHVRCKPREKAAGSGGGDSQPTVQALATLQASPAPLMVSGRVDSSSHILTFTENQTQKHTRFDGEMLTLMKARSGTITTSFSSTEQCRSEDISGLECCATVAGSRRSTLGALGTCTDGCTPISRRDRFCQAATGLPLVTDVFTLSFLNFRDQEKTSSTSFAGVNTSDFTQFSSHRTDLMIDWIFPDVQPDQQIDRIEVSATHPTSGFDESVVLIGSLSSFPVQVSGTSAVPGAVGTVVSLSPEPCPVTTIQEVKVESARTGAREQSHDADRYKHPQLHAGVDDEEH